MLELFTNPGYLAAAGALISAPIIIHLINRMRFKRLRWAAMEFLLKSQKRNRRRLIIEQLILLVLRILLVLLIGLLLARFLSATFALNRPSSTRKQRRARSRSCSMMSRRRLRFCDLSKNSIAAQRTRLKRIRLIRWMMIGRLTRAAPATR